MDKQAPKESCEICRKKFGGVFSNEHQCKRCLRTICKECCTKKKSIFTKINTKMEEHRCCDLCWPESESIAQYVKQNGLVFNTLSKEGKEWAELCDIDLLEGKPAPKSSKTKVEVYFHDAWTQMTASLREFSGLLVTKIALSVVDASLKHVYEKATTSNVEVTVGLAIYLLGHCDQKTTIKVFNYLIKIAQNLDQKAIGSYIELLCAAGDTQMDPKITKNLAGYAKNVYRSFTMAYFTNCFPIDLVHHIMLETLLSGDGQVLELVLACIIYEFRNPILSGQLDDKAIKYAIWQTVTLKHIEKSVKKLRKLIVRKNGLKASKAEKQAEKTAEEPVKTPPESQQSPSRLSEGLVNSNPQPEAEKEQNGELVKKIDEAAEFIRKIESGELNDTEMNLADLQSLQSYLDNIIMDNDRSLNECEQLDKLLNEIEGELYKNAKKTTKI